MKNAIAVIAVLLVAGASSAFAEDGQVSDSALSAIGLSGMQVVSDAEGMQVRGMSSNAMSMGTSLIFGQLIDPATKSFIAGSDINTSGASSENGGFNALSLAGHVQASGLLLGLNVVTPTSSFVGSLGGAAGGFGLASAF